MHKVIAFTCAIFMVACLIGCGGYVKTKPVLEVQIHGTALDSSGQPVANVLVYLQPLTPGSHPATLHIDEYGRFQTKVTVGKYLYYLDEEGERPATQILEVSCCGGACQLKF